MTTKTTEYDKFIFLEDNREKINQSHVKRLVSSISSLNLLHLRPIDVTPKMEVLDGQHRLLAAKQLGVEIYYNVQNNLSSHEIILMNEVKAWGMTDYHNFYIKNDYEEYKKLKEFMISTGLTLKVALSMCMSRSRESYYKFRNGKFIFELDLIQEDLSICWKTIEVISKINGGCVYVKTLKFWKALLQVIRNPRFCREKWFVNLKKMGERICPKATSNDYVKCFTQIYNFRNTTPLNFLEE
jgi:hypothetical protein